MTAAPTPAGGTPHHREDGELIGWILPAGDEFGDGSGDDTGDGSGDAWTAIDLLGRVAAASVPWLDAEAALEALGIGYLADPWVLDRPGVAPVRVRMLEVTPERIVVKVEDFGDINRPTERFELAWPIPPELRAARPGDPDAYAF